jgi:hypothetical protein
MTDEARRREQAQEAVRSGKLPSRHPDRAWGGPGVGLPCAVCELPITSGEMEYELQFAWDGDSPGLDRFHLHLGCFAAWEFERRTADT